MLLLPSPRAAAVALLVAATSAEAWYLPGSAPRSYSLGSRVPFTVNSLQPMTSGSNTGPSNGPGSGINSNTLQSLISLDYYDPRLHFCQPPGGAEAQSEGLGSALFGDRIYSSPIDASLLKEEKCRHICDVSVPAEDQRFINDVIRDQYAVNWMVDGLPVATKKVADRTNEIFYSIGFPMGRLLDDHGLPFESPALNNHLAVYIEYHRRKEGEYRIVGAYVFPQSKDSARSTGGPDCAAVNPLRLSDATT